MLMTLKNVNPMRFYKRAYRHLTEVAPLDFDLLDEPFETLADKHEAESNYEYPM